MKAQLEDYSNPLPSVTVAIPTYNEESHIEQVVKNFLNTGYPNLIEVLIADGMSTDKTQDIVKSLSLVDSRVKLIVNPQKIQSAALNLMLHEAQGDIFLRADAHCEYAPDYIEKCVEALLTSKALNVGGSQRYVAATPFQAGITLASGSFISGVAKYRDPEYNGYADTVYLGCFWKTALMDTAQENNGEAFDTTQVTNQDLELNLQLLQKNESAIYVSSGIQAWYYPRKTWLALFKQYFKYGRGSYLTAKKYPGKSPIRQKIPFLGILSLSCLWLIDLLLYQGRLKITWLVVLGLAMAMIESCRLVIKFGNSFDTELWRGKPEAVPSWVTRFYFCFVSLLTMPIAYALGYGHQLFRRKLLRIQGW